MSSVLFAALGGRARWRFSLAALVLGASGLAGLAAAFLPVPQPAAMKERMLFLPRPSPSPTLQESLRDSPRPIGAAGWPVKVKGYTAPSWVGLEAPKRMSIASWVGRKLGLGPAKPRWAGEAVVSPAKAALARPERGKLAARERPAGSGASTGAQLASAGSLRAGIGRSAGPQGISAVALKAADRPPTFEQARRFILDKIAPFTPRVPAGASGASASGASRLEASQAETRIQAHGEQALDSTGASLGVDAVEETSRPSDPAGARQGSSNGAGASGPIFDAPAAGRPCEESACGATASDGKTLACVKVGSVRRWVPFEDAATLCGAAENRCREFEFSPACGLSSKARCFPVADDRPAPSPSVASAHWRFAIEAPPQPNPCAAKEPGKPDPTVSDSAQPCVCPSTIGTCGGGGCGAKQQLFTFTLDGCLPAGCAKAATECRVIAKCLAGGSPKAMAVE